LRGKLIIKEKLYSPQLSQKQMSEASKFYVRCVSIRQFMHP
jgi:hypothetical protein